MQTALVTVVTITRKICESSGHKACGRPPDPLALELKMKNYSSSKERSGEYFFSFYTPLFFDLKHLTEQRDGHKKTGKPAMRLVRTAA